MLGVAHRVAAWVGGLFIMFGIVTMAAAFHSLPLQPAEPRPDIVREVTPTQPENQQDVAPALPRADFAHEVRFEAGQALPPSSFAGETVVHILERIERCGSKRVLVEGHSDQTGGEKWNLRLSWLRAKAVRDVLVRAGLEQDRIVIRAFGAYAPKVDEPLLGQPQRRVEIRVPGCPQGDDP